MSGAAPVQVVTFGLGDEVFAVSVTMVREILDYTPAFHVPGGPSWMVGLTNVRGQGVPMVDLRTRLGLSPVEPTLATRVLIVDVTLPGRTISMGLVVDRVIAIAAFDRNRLEAAPDVGMRWQSNYIDGVVSEADDFIVIMNVAHVFWDENVTDVADLLAVT